ncbi:FAD:protein FMN transferase [Methylomonas sp. AM2-LC]|uniref:FAD:protein FMN transferase n=1 Tax=Methylomonas sp. AM2-LC TaxID=3153301 RepID=UPI003264A1C7
MTPQRKKLGLFNYRFKAMGTVCSMQCYASSEEAGRKVSELVHADVSRLEQLYSRYLPESLLSNINRTAAQGGEIRLDEETAGLFNYAATCYENSDGLFDVTSGVLRRAWRFDQAQVPAQETIDALLLTVGWQKLVWEAPLLRFPVPGLEIDLGGVVKEYAADRAAVICQDAGIRHGFINLGGDIRIVGPHPDGSPWHAGIEHPRIKGEVLANLELFNGALACSGDYERCMVINGERYSHIINPFTGWPAKHMASVSVVADFCLVAGSASTIAMLKEADGPAWLEELGLPHLWMDVHGKTGSM